jgi:uncharacterized DUF497 family protein
MSSAGSAVGALSITYREANVQFISVRRARTEDVALYQQLRQELLNSMGVP